MLNMTQIRISDQSTPVELPAHQNTNLTHCGVKGYPTKETQVIIKAPDSSLAREVTYYRTADHWEDKCSTAEDSGALKLHVSKASLIY